MSLCEYPEIPECCVICGDEYDPISIGAGRLADHVQDATGGYHLVCCDDHKEFLYNHRLMTKEEAERYMEEELPEYTQADL